MDLFSNHPGAVYFIGYIVGMIAQVIIAGALVSIAISLRKRK